MMKQNKAQTGYLSQLSRWFKKQWSQDVPEDLVVCEFDCRKTQCLQGDWRTCERRLRGGDGNSVGGNHH